MGHPAIVSLPEDAAIVGRLVANRYLIEEPCERTPESAIYRARHLGSRGAGEAVLLRTLLERPQLTHEQCRGALSFAERAASLPTPHVARTLDVGVVAERWPFVISEYTKGQTLASILAQQGPLALRRALPIASVVASVLGMAHAAGIAHGALPASGIWVESPQGRPDWIRLLDFGARELPGPVLQTSQSGVFRSAASQPQPGAPFSPESVRSDLWALGALLYEMTLGSDIGTATRDVASELDARFARSGWGGERAIVRGFALVVERCLFPVPLGAYRSMDEVTRDLTTLAEAAAALQLAAPERRPPVTSIHVPARRATVALGGPKVIVRG